MKRTIATIVTAIVMITSFSAFAASPKAANPLKDVASTEIIITYVDAIANGNTDLNKFLFASDFEYRNCANNKRFNKAQYCSFLKKNSDLHYNCETSYEILDQSGNACMAKAIMKFNDFTRVDYITLAHEQDGWKVSKVVTTYP